MKEQDVMQHLVWLRASATRAYEDALDRAKKIKKEQSDIFIPDPSDEEVRYQASVIHSCDYAISLVKGKMEGRVLVLPCQMGTAAYMVTSRWAKYAGRFYFVKQTVLSWHNAERFMREFGKTIFFTREEAERALEAIRNEQKGETY